MSRKTEATTETKQAEKKSEDLTTKKISEIKAAARFIRISPRKVRLVVDQVRGMDVVAALDLLKFVHKAAATPVYKLIYSAVANAENNFKLERKNLYIKSILANEGPTLKRYRPRAHGRSSAIRKKMSHIEVILASRTGIAEKPKAEKHDKQTKEKTKKSEPKKSVKKETVNK